MSDLSTGSPPQNPPPGKKTPDKSMIFMGMGIEAVVAVLGGFWIGLQLDGYLGKRGIGPAIGSILMLVGWFVHLLQVMKRFDEEQ
jgi:hypothetical protein